MLESTGFLELFNCTPRDIKLSVGSAETGLFLFQSVHSGQPTEGGRKPNYGQ